MKHYTTIKQSKHLLDLGLNPKSADMWWLYVTAQGKHIAMMYEEPDPHYLARMESYGIKNAAIPCWSLGALLEIMPEIDNQLPSLRKYKNYYYVVYSDITTRLGDSHWQNGKTPAEAAYNMVWWLLKNGYIKKGE